MAWTIPMTAVPGSVFTAAQWNMFVRDNLNETMPAKATTAGRYFMTTGPHAIAERHNTQDVVNASASTDSQSFTDLSSPGPEVTIRTGDRAWIFMRAEVENNTIGQTSVVSISVDGATEIEPITARGAFLQSMASGQHAHVSSATTLALTPGNNTFTMRYRVTGGIGTFQRRRILVMAL